MKVINVPEELIVQGKRVLYFQDAIKAVIREFTNDIVKNHYEVAQVWKLVEEEAKKQGIVRKEDEMFVFDHITEKYLLIKRA